MKKTAQFSAIFALLLLSAGTTLSLAKGTGSGGGGGKVCAAVCYHEVLKDVCISESEYERYEISCPDTEASCWIDLDSGTRIQLSACVDSKQLPL